MARRSVQDAGCIAAAMIGAPAAALLAAMALAAGLPVGSEVRLLVAELVPFPLVAAGACAALLARSWRRAWAGCALVATLAAAVLVLAS